MVDWHIKRLTSDRKISMLAPVLTLCDFSELSQEKVFLISHMFSLFGFQPFVS